MVLIRYSNNLRGLLTGVDGHALESTDGVMSLGSGASLYNTQWLAFSLILPLDYFFFKA